MNVPLPSARRRAAVLVACCALALLLGFLGLRNAAAAHYQGKDTRDGYLRAVRLEPGNSRNWYLLGRSYLYDFGQPDIKLAVESLRRAIALDSYSAEALLDLAAGYEEQGEVTQARTAYLSAQRVYPQSADVAWSYGNFLLRQGENDAAFAELHKALELDPKRAAEAFSRAVSATLDVNAVLDKMVPANAETYLPILHVLSASDDLTDAEVLWSRLVALHPKILLRDVVVFFDQLIHDRRPEDAARLWPQAVSIMQNPPPPDPDNSIIWDGSFESGFSGGGFSWQFKPVDHDVQIGWDRSEKHSGEQSLRILFNGRENIDFHDACHQMVVEPGRRYLLTAWIKTLSLTSSQGVRLEINVYSGSGILNQKTDEVHGTRDWTQVQLEWQAAEDAEFGRVCAKRNMSDMPGSDIEGAAWIDDVVMVPIPSEKKGTAGRP